MIRCFSGTGNSRMVARELGDELAQSRDDVVWVFPVHAWGVPRRVLDEIAHAADLPSGARHWMIAVCGDDIGHTDREWRRAVEARGFTAAGAYSVAMPNTYICLPGFTVDSPEVAARKLEAMPATVRSIRHDILAQRSDVRVTRGAFAGLKSGLLRWFFLRFLMSAKRFTVSEACNGCGTCGRLCPVGNIVIVNGRPEFGDRCTMCLACLHGCPRRAIDWGRFTRGKERYAPCRHESNVNTAAE